MPGSTHIGFDSAAPAADAVEVKALDEQKSLISDKECNLYGYDILNLDATNYYLHLFNKAAIADVTLGTTVPDLVLPIKASEHLLVLPNGALKHFTVGIVAAIKTVNTTAGTTGPTTDAPAVFYKK